ncbi:MAG: glycine--tRNA ligase subunit beta [Caldiserica bacterium]|nr:MAG: glycine--tRNA ligase subunit beta [Caldisericota bacterium]
MKDYLLEIYVEEIPARFLNNAVKDLKTAAESELTKYNLHYEDISVFGTPRRLTLYIKGLDENEPDTEEEIKGPPASIAIGKNEEHLVPFKKFALSADAHEKDLYIKETSKGNYLFAKKIVKGRRTEDILKIFSPWLIKSLKFPKAMHWNNKSIKFVRPIRSLLSLFGEDLVKFTYAEVEAGDSTYGLRINQSNKIKVKNPADYFKKLKENYVTLSYDERKNNVEKNAHALAKKINGAPLYSNDFLEEVVNLTEYPTPFLATIGKEEFSIPQCISIRVIEDHLKSFPCVDKNGKLLPYFIGVRNGCSDFIEIVKRGYEKVIKARMLDGKFFFEEDKKIPLSARVSKLSGVVFLKDLGTMKDKIDRLTILSDFISPKIGLNDNESKALKRSAYLSKADLLTNIAREFPDLQGEIGGIYAKLQGEDTEVYEAIKDQYLPHFTDDKLPKTLIGTCLSLIDKIDTLTGGFLMGIAVSGSKDPYGLRRIGNSIVQLLTSINMESFPLKELVQESIDLYKPKKEIESEETSKDIDSFLKERIKGILKEKNIRYDIINAVTALSLDLITTYKRRAEVLTSHISDEELTSIVLANKRVNNILLNTDISSKTIDKKLLFEKEEEGLFDAIQNTKIKVENGLKQMNYEEIIKLLYSLSPVISKFFDKVLVMDNDEKIRKNRLAMLINLKELFLKFADFSAIVIEKDKNI